MISRSRDSWIAYLKELGEDVPDMLLEADPSDVFSAGYVPGQGTVPLHRDGGSVPKAKPVVSIVPLLSKDS